MHVTYPTAMTETHSRVLELSLGESFRIGDHVVSVIDADDHEVRVIVEYIGDAEEPDADFEWDDSWQSRLGD